MSDINSKKRLVLGAAAFIAVVGVFVGAYVWFWEPFSQKQAEEQAEQEHQEIIDATSSQSHFKHEITIVMDGFSGYSAYRDPVFHNLLASKEIKVNIVDDGANYKERAAGLRDGKYDLAVYTIDAVQSSFADLGDLPGTIVAITDETKGADAMVAAGAVFPNVDALNDPNVKIVCTPDSPSETLARVVMRYYNLPKLPRNPFEYVDGAKAVYDAYRKSKPGDKKVYVLWEPYVSKMVQNPDYHDLMNSSKFRGYIVDVLVAQRGFLYKNETVVEEVVKAYFTTIFQKRNSMVEMVMDDARKLGEPLRREQAEKLVNTIWFKNTQENFAHFGLTSGHGLQHIEEMIRNITDVLIQTGGIQRDPTGGQPNKLYYDSIMRKLFSDGWHPGFGQETIRSEGTLAVLSEEEWKTLKPVGTLNIPRLVFARGTARLSDRSEDTLKDLTDKLKNWPQYYLVVRGNSAKSDDPDVDAANRALAQQRADSTVKWLVEHGVDKNRIRAEAGQPNGSTTVAFVLGEVPY